MCGVVAYFPHDTNDGFDFGDARLMFTRVMQESKVRGLHSFGLADTGSVFKSHSLEAVTQQFEAGLPTIAHCRYSTSGDWHVLANCQPIRAGGYTLVFNGVIHMGTKEEYEAAFDVKCESDNDGEIFLRRLIAGQDAAEFIREMTGSFAGAWLYGTELWVGRNTRRPLWITESGGATWVASTQDIFRRAGLPPGEEMKPGVRRIQ